MAFLNELGRQIINHNDFDCLSCFCLPLYPFHTWERMGNDNELKIILIGFLFFTETDLHGHSFVSLASENQWV